MRNWNTLERMEDEIEQDLLILPYMVSLPQVFTDSSLAQQHAIIRQVVKDGLTYRQGMFRTPSINPDIKCNLLILKKEGLLDVEQPSGISTKTPYCGEGGIRTLGTVSRTSV